MKQNTTIKNKAGHPMIRGLAYRDQQEEQDVYYVGFAPDEAICIPRPGVTYGEVRYKDSGGSYYLDIDRLVPISGVAEDLVNSDDSPTTIAAILDLLKVQHGAALAGKLTAYRAGGPIEPVFKEFINVFMMGAASMQIVLGAASRDKNPDIVHDALKEITTFRDAVLAGKFPVPPEEISKWAADALLEFMTDVVSELKNREVKK